MDGTGPMGNGQPGRGLGRCGRMQGSGMGRGFGLRRRACHNGQTTNEVYPYNQTELQSRKQELESQIEWLNKELNKELNKD